MSTAKFIILALGLAVSAAVSAQNSTTFTADIGNVTGTITVNTTNSGPITSSDLFSYDFTNVPRTSYLNAVVGSVTGSDWSCGNCYLSISNGTLLWQPSTLADLYFPNQNVDTENSSLGLLVSTDANLENLAFYVSMPTGGSIGINGVDPVSMPAPELSIGGWIGAFMLLAGMIAIVRAGGRKS